MKKNYINMMHYTIMLKINFLQKKAVFITHKNTVKFGKMQFFS